MPLKPKKTPHYLPHPSPTLQLSALEALCSAATKQSIGKVLSTVPLAIDGNSVVLEQGKGTSLGTLAEGKGGNTNNCLSADWDEIKNGMTLEGQNDFTCWDELNSIRYRNEVIMLAFLVNSFTDVDPYSIIPAPRGLYQLNVKYCRPSWASWVRGSPYSLDLPKQ